MDDDGGLSQRRAELAALKAATDERRQLDHEAVEEALREQGARIKKAIAAFLQAVAQQQIPPERFIIGGRQVGPKPLPRFGKEGGAWGLHERMPPTEPVYKLGYTLYEWQWTSEADAKHQTVVMWQSGETELRDLVRGNNRRGFPSNGHEGALPFRLGHSGELHHGAVQDDATERQVDNVRRTADSLVSWLAAYLEKPRT